MQFQADILNMTIERPDIIETTGFGVAGVSGIASQVWSIQEFAKCRRVNKQFIPGMTAATRQAYYSKWKEATTRSLHWASQ